MIRFLFGDDALGKTEHILEQLRKDADSDTVSILIVPEQQAVQTEILTLNALPPSAQLTLEVLNFSRLYNRVCREYGGLEYNYLTKPAKQLIMWRTLNELSPMLEHYRSSVERDAALPEKMLSALMEFKANGIVPRDLERAADKLEAGLELRAKLEDLARIYSVYSAFVSEGYGDSADDISKLDEILSKHDFFRGMSVYIDSFTSYTSAEHSVIEKIFAGAAQVTLTIPLPSQKAKTIYTESISYAEKKLIEAAERRGGYNVEVLSENKRAKYPALAFLAKNIWSCSDRMCRTFYRL